MFETDKQQLDVINRRRTNERQLVFSVSNPSRQKSVTEQSRTSRSFCCCKYRLHND